MTKLIFPRDFHHATPEKPLYLCAMTATEISRHFPSLEKELVQEIETVATVRSFAEGVTLMRTGQNIRAALLVLDGLVKIYREDEGGSSSLPIKKAYLL